MNENVHEARRKRDGPAETLRALAGFQQFPLRTIGQVTRDSLRTLCVDYAGNPVACETMRPAFAQIEAALPRLLRERHRWRDVVVDDTPAMNRLYRDWNNEFRIFLHWLDPTPPGQSPILHYHQWPCMVKVHEGGYRQLLAYGPPGPVTPSPCASIDISPGATYELVHPHLWHAVLLEQPAEPSWSTMLVRKQSWGTPLQVTPRTQSMSFPSLDPNVREEMFRKFEEWYP